ncbi:MAG: TrmB family transcriptional regulator [Candidatus Thorarchaeota archaeon]
MNKLSTLLKKLNFTQYEAQILETLIKYHILSAYELHKYSGVPQPKIYETMVRLQQKSFIDIIPRGRKKLYMVKPREYIEEKLLNYTKQIQDIGKDCITIIDNTYNSEEAEEIPFIGIAGGERIQEYLYMLIDTAKNSIISFFPKSHFDDKIISILNDQKDNLDIKLVFQDNSIINLQRKLPEIEFRILKSPAFKNIKNIFDKIKNFIPLNHKSSYTFQILENIVLNLEEIFGLIVIDDRKSFFKIPIPIDLPMAIFSTSPEVVQFHLDGITEILNSSVKLERKNPRNG